jgi:hypothetical protein
MQQQRVAALKLAILLSAAGAGDFVRDLDT